MLLDRTVEKGGGVVLRVPRFPRFPRVPCFRPGRPLLVCNQMYCRPRPSMFWCVYWNQNVSFSDLSFGIACDEGNRRGKCDEGNRWVMGAAELQDCSELQTLSW